MLNNLAISNFSSIYTQNSYKKNLYNAPLETSEQNISNSSDRLMNTLNCMSVISFGSLQSGLNKTSLIKRLSNLVAQELPVDFDLYQFMKRSPRGFYLEYGREVNKFLRTGTFDELPVITESMSPSFKSIIEDNIVESKKINRTIIESLDVLDAQLTSKTTEPMTVYRDAPRQWMDTAKDGILTDAGYLSTSTERGASAEGLICNGADNFTYEIRLPKGTKFLDLTYTTEKEMLLPRGCKFKIIGNGILELIP